jgi:hypothetical protein
VYKNFIKKFNIGGRLRKKDLTQNNFQLLTLIMATAKSGTGGRNVVVN